MKRRILFMLIALVMATQCACTVPAELQGLTEEELLSAIQAFAADYKAEEDQTADTTVPEETVKAEAAKQAVAAGADAEVETVDEIIAAYNFTCKEVSTPAKEGDVYHPVSIVQCACYQGDCYMVYPQVQDVSSADAINGTIQSKVVEQAEMLNMPVFASYKVEYNRNGIFSLRMLLYDLYGDFEKYIACIPMTFNVETGELYSLDDFFNSEDQSWRGRIPDLITTQAENSNMVLLSDILPVSDDQHFYITDEAVVITYDLYEIATYSAGEPEFEISVGELAEYIAPDGILNVFLTPAPVEESSGEQPDTEGLLEEDEVELPEATQEHQPSPVPDETYALQQLPSEGEATETLQPEEVQNAHPDSEDSYQTEEEIEQ